MQQQRLVKSTHSPFRYWTIFKLCDRTVATAWRQADALKEAGVERTLAIHPLLEAIRSGEFQPTRNTVLVIDEISQVGPRAMLELLELQGRIGLTIKALGDREQAQAIEAGDTIELLRRALPKSEMPGGRCLPRCP
jgi:hypothetical protein